MPLITPLLVSSARRAHGIFEALLSRLDERARVRRERSILLELDAMNDDRLYDLGLSREAIRCGLRASRQPMATARACRVRPIGGLHSKRWGDPTVWPDRPVAHERYLGW